MLLKNSRSKAPTVRPQKSAGNRRRHSSVFCAAAVLFCALFSACGQNNLPSPSSAAPSPQTVSSSAAAPAVSSAASSAAPSQPSSAVSRKPSSQEPAASVIYEYKKYGLRVTLPADWKGYKVLTQKWSAFKVSDPTVTDAVSGPEIVLRSPKWTKEKPYQDIPIMIFTPSEWNQLDQDVLHIGAAPVGPQELARNSGYVFGLPARYNFAFPAGYEEVDQIVSSGAVTAVEPAR